MSLPILITWLRIILIPFFVLIFLLPDTPKNPQAWQNYLGASIFGIACITDWLDGYLARRWNQTSSFGAFLDPVADKLIVAAALILLVALHRVPGWCAMIIIGREITISALREWMAQIGKNSQVRVAQIGRFKTAFQMIAITLLLFFEPVSHINITLIGTYCLYIATLLTLVSMAYYLHAAYESLKTEDA